MIKIGPDSRLYKFLEKVYLLMKLNFFIFIMSFTIIGVGGAISAGFYELKQGLEKGVEVVTFKSFIKNFKKNLKKGLFFTAPVIWIIFLLFLFFGNVLLGGNVIWGFLFILINLSFVMLIVNGLVDMSVKNIIAYSVLIFIKKIFFLILGNIVLFFSFKIIAKTAPGLLVFFNWILILVMYYFIYGKMIINDSVFKKNDKKMESEK